MSLESWCDEMRGDWDDLSEVCELHNLTVDRDKFDGSLSLDAPNLSVESDDWSTRGEELTVELESGSVTVERSVSRTGKIL